MGVNTDSTGSAAGVGPLGWGGQTDGEPRQEVILQKLEWIEINYKNEINE